MGTSWPAAQIGLAYRAGLEKRSTELVTLLNHFKIENQQSVVMLAKLQSGQTAEDIANEWIESHQNTILEWLTGFNLPQKDKQ
ncbi:glycine betaine ABC transporter substrate-binding protein [Shewanella sp. UCD-KL21]|uniref:glycine betaine ABC transporter substrate-binding protein n=1 Tax=Shewanella sp. UCD-KL21 TaxID=1917164 RepID=UPI000970DE10|nr:glycine betaine ABC transporter substrate-binding protein [Shewanella sp. UCD-KL21]